VQVKSKISLGSRLVTNPNLVLRVEDDDCGLLFDPDLGQVRVLNRSAVEIWNLIDGRRSLRELLAVLEDIFDGMGPEAETQVLQTVDSLMQIGAVANVEQGN
jgi:hypothetical protein